MELALREERRAAGHDFTAAFVDEQIAVVLDGGVLSAPIVNEPLSGAGIISGRFTQAEVDAIVAALESDALPAPLELVALRPRAAC